MDYTRHIIRYSKVVADLTSGTTTLRIRGPKGKRGLLMDYGFHDVTTTFAGATNPPEVKVGDGTTDNKYGKVFNPGNLTGPGGGASVASTTVPGTSAWTALMAQRETTADVDVVLTVVNAAGGGAAGVGTIFMEIAWDA